MVSLDQKSSLFPPSAPPPPPNPPTPFSVLLAAGPNACFSITAKKIPNKVEARMQPCFTPLHMLKVADVEPSKTTVLFMSSWKDLMMLRSLDGHPILGRISKRPSLLTRSKAFMRSMKATKSGCLCSLHFSWSF